MIAIKAATLLHSSCVSPTELIQDVIAQHRQRTGEHTVEFLHRRQQSWVPGNPRFCGTWWDRYADSDAFFQHKPRRKGSSEFGTAMIHNGKFAFGESR